MLELWWETDEFSALLDPNVCKGDESLRLIRILFFTVQKIKLSASHHLKMYLWPSPLRCPPFLLGGRGVHLIVDLLWAVPLFPCTLDISGYLFFFNQLSQPSLSSLISPSLLIIPLWPTLSKIYIYIYLSQVPAFTLVFSKRFNRF